jgi:hypothetical protein
MMTRKTFMSELTHSNRRKGFRNSSWGALFDVGTGGWIACVPRAEGDHHREHVGLFPTEEEASAAALATYRQRRRAVPHLEAVSHLDAAGQICHCARGLMSMPGEFSARAVSRENWTGGQ